MPASFMASTETRTIRSSTSLSSCLPKGVWAQPTMQAVMANLPGMGGSSRRISSRLAEPTPAREVLEALRKPHGHADRRAQDLVLAHDDIPADDRGLGPARHCHADKGRPAGPAGDPAFLDGAL